jgi:arylsulfatase A-like enzyme
VTAGCVSTDAPEPARPNVVIIYADDLGYGDVGCYGATKLKTPRIDRLAREGRMFMDAHSASAVCTPSRYALLTGRYPFRKNLYSPVFHKRGLVIDANRLTMADLMKEQGYATACIGKWHLGFGDETPDWNGELKPGPLELGFDYYYGIPVVNSHPPFVYVENHRVVGLDPRDPFIYGVRAATREFQEKFGLETIGGARAAHELYDDRLVGKVLAQKAVNWLRDHADEPFFLYLATTNIHHPYTPQQRFDETSECGRYGDFVHELDWIVGEILDTLEDLSVADDTLVVFTSDNGPMLNQGGQDAWRNGHRMNGGLLGFKFDVWEGGHRVPFIIRWPGKVEAGSRSDQLLGQVDMLATLAALTGYELEEGEGPDSYNMMPAMVGSEEKRIRDHLVMAANRGESHIALRSGKWVYIGAQGGGGTRGKNVGDHGFGGPAAMLFTGQKNSDISNGAFKPDAPREQLYDLEADLSQSTNVVREHLEVAARLKERLEEIKRVSGTRPGASGEQGIEPR